jgi:hypothetical protein
VGVTFSDDCATDEAAGATSAIAPTVTSAVSATSRLESLLAAAPASGSLEPSVSSSVAGTLSSGVVGTLSSGVVGTLSSGVVGTLSSGVTGAASSPA